MQYTEEELKKIIEDHRHYLNNDCTGWSKMRADLVGADLRNADLRNADLRNADLRNADLSGATLIGANLIGANLRSARLRNANLRSANLIGANLEYAHPEYANLTFANLRSANLRFANLRFADIIGANLEGANLEGAYLKRADLEGAYLRLANLTDANLEGANLVGANLEGARLEEKEKFRLGQILKEPITGFKKTLEGVVITATIPAGAIVFCINGRKCRTNKARIIDMGGQNEVLHSSFDDEFEYRLFQDIEIEDFNLMYNVECATGFHFFRTCDEAKNYTI